MKQNKLIDLHKQWMEIGYMGKPDNYDGGLCNLIPDKYKKDFNLLKITDEDKTQCIKEKLDWVFWAYGLKATKHYIELAYAYTPLRQTIVLFICAMRNEI